MKSMMPISMGALLICLSCPSSAVAAETVIESLDHNGKIQWQVVETSDWYTVQWAASLDGPWHESWDHLKLMTFTGATASASVPLFFRILRTPWDQGLVYWMPCDGDLLDHSQYSNNPTLHGAATLDVDRAGNPSRALRLDLGQYLTATGTPHLATTNVTVAFWVKFASFVSHPYVLEMGPQLTAWSIFIEGSPYLRGGAATPTLGMNQSLDTNQWYHMAATINGTEAVMYFDGLPRATGSVAKVSSAIDYLYIGSDSTPSGPPHSYMLNGSLDDLRIYNRPLSASEIADIYSLPP